MSYAAVKPSADGGEERHGSVSPELLVMSQLQGTDFEMALIEAGMCVGISCDRFHIIVALQLDMIAQTLSVGCWMIGLCVSVVL